MRHQLVSPGGGAQPEHRDGDARGAGESHPSRQNMKSNFKPALLLVALTMVVPELLTGSSSIREFLNPAHINILFWGYGVAILLVREIAVRNNLSFAGIFILGLAFGVFNEGLLAKTLIRASELPISQYNQYGYLLGISFPFTFAISFWHALASVLVPILLTYWMYPNNKNRPWLNRKLTSFLTIALLVIGSASLLGKEPVQGTPLQLTVLVGLMFIAFLIARRYIQTTDTSEVSADLTLKPVGLGLSLFFTYFLLLLFIAGNNLPVISFFIIFFFLLWLYYAILKRNGWLTQRYLILFGIGNYLQNTILATLLAFTIPTTLIERVATGIATIILLTWLTKKIQRSIFVERASHS